MCRLWSVGSTGAGRRLGQLNQLSEAGPNLCSWKKQKPVETKEKLATVPRGDSTWASLGQQLGLKSQLLAAM
jgi:hypothetical protein